MVNQQKMKTKKYLIWSLIVNDYQSLLSPDERAAKTFIPILSALFPGINYYSITGYSQVMNNYGIPALKKLFPEVEKLNAEEVSKNDEVEILPFLNSKGYEWQDDSNWGEEFNRLLAA